MKKTKVYILYDNGENPIGVFTEMKDLCDTLEHEPFLDYSIKTKQIWLRLKRSKRN